MKSIKSVVQDNLCSGCGACVAICPKDAIAMTLTSIGWLKASVWEDLCIDCGICQKVCPSLDFHQTILPKDDDVYLGKTFHVYTGISTDPAIYENAQSGGADSVCCSENSDPQVRTATISEIQLYSGGYVFHSAKN